MKGYQNIVCAIDLSEFSGLVIERAVDQCGQHDAKLTLLHVIENFPEDRTNEMIAPEDIDPARYHEQEALARLSDLAAQHDCRDAERAVQFSIYSAGREIVRYADEHQVDLIVVGSHGHNGLTSLLGSTANRVVQTAPGDVLAVRIRNSTA
jgi:universal stress protein A